MNNIIDINNSNIIIKLSIDIFLIYFLEIMKQFIFIINKLINLIYLLRHNYILITLLLKILLIIIHLALIISSICVNTIIIFVIFYLILQKLIF
jgi:hypothetical protein